jgi:hypothetical protein
VATQVGAQRPGVGVAARTVFVGRFGDDRLQIAAEFAAHRRQLRRIDLAHDADRLAERQAVDFVGARARQRFEDQDAERVDVGPRVDVVPALRLLGTHVPRGAEEPARRRRGRRCEPAPDRLRDAEVQHARPRRAVVRRRRFDEDVGGLEVAMHDAVPMGVRDGVADVGERAHELRDTVAPPRGVRIERFALDVLHREPRQRNAAEIGDAGLVELRDAGMPERPEHFDLERETAARRVRKQSRFDDLQRGPSGRGRAPRFVHGAHAAAPEEPLRDVGPDRLAAQRIVEPRLGDAVATARRRLAQHVLLRGAEETHQPRGPRRIALREFGQPPRPLVGVEFREDAEELAVVVGIDRGHRASAALRRAVTRRPCAR